MMIVVMIVMLAATFGTVFIRRRAVIWELLLIGSRFLPRPERRPAHGTELIALAVAIAARRAYSAGCIRPWTTLNYFFGVELDFKVLNGAHRGCHRLPGSRHFLL